MLLVLLGLFFGASKNFLVLLGLCFGASSFAWTFVLEARFCLTFLQPKFGK